MPSMAPPDLIAKPLPMPEISPPNKAHKRRSVPANGEAMLTSTGNTSVISHAQTEYITTA